MEYEFTLDFDAETSLGFAEGTVDILYFVSDSEIYIRGAIVFKGKLYNLEGNTICDFAAPKHYELGNELYAKLEKSIIHACNEDYRKVA